MRKDEKTPERCLSCNSCSNIEHHHVCYYKYERVTTHINYKRRSSNKPYISWVGSITVPLCKSCHDIFHRVDILSEFLDVCEHEHISVVSGANLFDVIEDAIRLSYILPLIDKSLLGKDYSKVVKKVGSYDEAKLLIANHPPSNIFGTHIKTYKMSERKYVLRQICFRYLKIHSKLRYPSSQSAISNVVKSTFPKRFGGEASTREIRGALDGLCKDGLIEEVVRTGNKSKDKWYIVTDLGCT